MHLGIDPGQLRGYAVIDPTREVPRAFGLRLGALVCCGVCLEDVSVAVTKVAVEYQYGGRITTGEVRAKDIIKLAFRAGFALCEALTVYDLTEGVAVLPTTWKGALFRNGGQVAKSVYTARIEKMLTRAERAKIPRNRRGKLDDNVLDAVGIAWALGELTDAQRTIGRVNFDQILPKGSN